MLRTRPLSLVCAAALVLVVGCSSSPDRTPGTRPDAGVAEDASATADASTGADAGVVDAAPPDAGFEPPTSASPVALETYVRTLATDFVPRDYGHPENLDRAAAFIRAELATVGIPTEEQVYTAMSNGEQYRNIIARLGPMDGPRIIVGAHYDAFSVHPGADDNASGTAGLIELAKILSGHDLSMGVEIVAYSLEEPPSFRTQEMGSAVHAASVAGQDIPVAIVLEMIGYYTDEPNTQTYPIPALETFYGNVGDFVAVVGRTADEPFIDRLDTVMSAATGLPVHPLAAPPSVTGVDFSDHLNYWANGMNALMLTDTAFYRNELYHTAQDTPDTLDYGRMANVVDGLVEGILSLMREPL